MSRLRYVWAVSNEVFSSGVRWPKLKEREIWHVEGQPIWNILQIIFICCLPSGRFPWEKVKGGDGPGDGRTDVEEDDWYDYVSALCAHSPRGRQAEAQQTFWHLRCGGRENGGARVLEHAANQSSAHHQVFCQHCLIWVAHFYYHCSVHAPHLFGPFWGFGLISFQIFQTSGCSTSFRMSATRALAANHIQQLITPGNGIVSGIERWSPKSRSWKSSGLLSFLLRILQDITGYEQKWYHITTIGMLYIIL